MDETVETPSSSQATLVKQLNKLGPSEKKRPSDAKSSANAGADDPSGLPREGAGPENSDVDLEVARTEADQETDCSTCSSRFGLWSGVLVCMVIYSEPSWMYRL